MSFFNALTTAARSSNTFALKTLQQRTFASVTETAIKASPVATHVQAFLRDFKTNEPMSIMDLDAKVFGAPLRKDILHRVVVWQRDNMRQGTASTKGRADVRGTSKKAAPQKGRGKARVGNMKAPHFRGGGIAFGPKPRDHGTELPRKVQEFGLRVALSTKYAQDQLTVVDSFQTIDSHKTRDLNQVLQHTYNHDSTILMIINEENEKLELAARNIPRCEVIYVEETNVLDLLTYDKVFVEKSAVGVLESALATV
ncbi:ribosomal protein L4/L1 family-domain-containing protein [Halteromyces radiatus]|uniref:ribosomal protein L4/L1 family-domain-containing protein n=1 Tax=Halteromyces radiatus TaxID=101107 RepID=UPI002220BEB8|nr:ribosomal protein L4/L1 family-domain-containing protein [Halteromyces radiatus]KAI8099378.1 ribosomal protein L4/L1 family-domain-containing protein [Halteromyces radiatus]